MLRDWYRRWLFLFFLVYIFLIIVFTPCFLNKKEPSQKICGYVISYPDKYYKEYRFFLKTGNSKFLVSSNSQRLGEISLYDYICFDCEHKRIESKNLPGNFNFEKYLRYKNVFYSLEIKGDIEIKKSHFLFAKLSSLRKKIKEIISDNFYKDELAVIMGILLGEKEDLSKDFRKAVINSGVMHLLVASGSNVAYIATMVAIIFSIFGFNNKLSKLISLLFVFSYAFIVGFDPPITRAFLMFIFGYLIYSIKRNIDLFQILILCAFTMIIFNPLSIYDSGFQLSFLSVYGIITGYSLYSRYFLIKKINIFKKDKLNDFVKDISNKIISMVLLTIFAQLAIFPLLVISFYKVSVISPLSNIFLIPISGIIMSASIFLFIFNKIMIVSNFLVFVLKILVSLFIKLCFYFSSFSFSIIYFNFTNDLNLVLSFIIIFIILNFPIIDLTSPISRSFISLVLIFFFISLIFKDKKTGVIDFENFNIKGNIISKDEGVYIINPVVGEEKIISSLYYLNNSEVKAILVTSKSGFKKDIIEALRKNLDVDKVYVPLWLGDKDYISVFDGDNAEIFDVKFYNKYGYFNYKSKLLYCYRDVCY